MRFLVGLLLLLAATTAHADEVVVDSERHGPWVLSCTKNAITDAIFCAMATALFRLDNKNAAGALVVYPLTDRSRRISILIRLDPPLLFEQCVFRVGSQPAIDHRTRGYVHPVCAPQDDELRSLDQGLSGTERIVIRPSFGDADDIWIIPSSYADAKKALLSYDAKFNPAAPDPADQPAKSRPKK